MTPIEAQHPSSPPAWLLAISPDVEASPAVAALASARLAAVCTQLDILPDTAKAWDLRLGQSFGWRLPGGFRMVDLVGASQLVVMKQLSDAGLFASAAAKLATEVAKRVEDALKAEDWHRLASSSEVTLRHGAVRISIKLADVVRLAASALARARHGGAVQ